MPHINNSRGILCLIAVCYEMVLLGLMCDVILCCVLRAACCVLGVGCCVLRVAH